MSHPLVAADVYDRLGGKAALTQLIDPEGRGTWNEQMLDKAMGDAWLDVISYTGVQTSIEGLTTEQIRDAFPDYVSKAARLTVPILWVSATGGQALPPTLASLKAELLTQLEAMAQRRRKHGGPNTDPSAAQRVVRISLDDGRMTLASFKGFI